MTFNSISLIGYLGHDPVAGQTTSGTPTSRFSMATTERRKTANGEVVEHTSWFKVTAYGRSAEIAQAHLAKGKQVFVRGPLRLEEYTDRDGVKRSSAEVRATDLMITGTLPVAETQEPEEEYFGSMADDEPAPSERSNQGASA